ncbi:MAG: glycosyltransferase [Saprospiraceae bacterium]|nr:glycosyltransferase [Saprospiraceae bacterium]
MKMLLVTKKFPYPLKEGEPIAINYLAKSLVALGWQIDLLVLNTSKHFFDPADLPADQNFFHEIHSVKVHNHITLAGAFKSLMAGQSYILDRFYSTKFAQKLKELLLQNKYDAVQLETIYLAHYTDIVRENSAAVLSLRAHNVEHRIWERVAATTQNPLKKWYLNNQNRQLRKFEMAALNKFDLLIAITQPDLDEFKGFGLQNRSVVAPVGIDLRDYPDVPLEPQFIQQLCFIGALDWMPNQHGLVWFLENVWPKLKTKFLGCSFHIAGKNTPDWVQKKAEPSVKVHGEVPDAKAFIIENGILVAPVFSGSGIKIKVMEGMALGRVVVTTEIGAEGISAVHGQDFLLANDAEAFEARIKWCFENPSAAAEIGRRARAFIAQHYDLREIAQKVSKAYESFAMH